MRSKMFHSFSGFGRTRLDLPAGPAPHRTRTIVVKPEAIPDIYLGQISELLKTYLNAELGPDQVIPYMSRVYRRFVLLTSANGRLLCGFAGVGLVPVESTQLLYLGAAVVRSGYRGGSKLYRPLLYHILAHRLKHPQQDLYVFGAMVNPYAYAALSRRITTLRPTPTDPDLPDAIKRKTIVGLKQLYDIQDSGRFNLEKGIVYPALSMQPLEEKPVDLDNPALRFFVERNPEYRNGVGLIFAAPVTAQTIRDAFESLVLTELPRLRSGPSA